MPEFGEECDSNPGADDGQRRSGLGKQLVYIELRRRSNQRRTTTGKAKSMGPASSTSAGERCDTVRDWLASRPVRDNPGMAGAAPSLTWNEWVEQGRSEAHTEACLLELLENEQDPLTRSDIAMALGYVGGDRSVSALVGLLQHEESVVAMEAAAALGRIGNRTAVAPLIDALKSDEPNVRANACQALGTLGGEQATTALTDALRDTDSFVRSAAQDALSRGRR